MLTLQPGCGAMAISNVNNVHQLYGILVLAGLGIGGIIVPASIITTIICPDVSLLPLLVYFTIIVSLLRDCLKFYFPFVTLL